MADVQLVIGVHRRDGITTPLRATINQSTVTMTRVTLKNY